MHAHGLAEAAEATATSDARSDTWRVTPCIAIGGGSTLTTSPVTCRSHVHGSACEALGS